MQVLLLPSNVTHAKRDSGEPAPPLIVMPPHVVPEPGDAAKRMPAFAVPSARMRPPLATTRFKPDARYTDVPG